MRAAALVAAVTASLALPLPARPDPRPLRYDLRRDGAIAGTALAFWVGTELSKERLAPSACRFCGTNALDAAARDALVWGHDGHARRASDVLAFGILPAALAGHQLLAARGAGDGKEGLVDLLIVAEAAALAATLNQIVKLSVGRQRPFVRYGNWAGPSREPDPDDNLSFYSGHTTLAFALASAAGTVSSMRGYESTPWVWGVGMTAAATIGWLRIAGDKHYLTDVLVGAATGTAAGVLLPRLLHGREDEAPAASGFVPVPFGFVYVF